jgi:penicillin-binding protein 1A
LKKAFIAIEDERFEKHRGVDVQGLISAVFNKLAHPGRPMRGASTITQQVVRNINGTFDRKLSRKIQEQWSAIQLERKLNKDEILELYMNVIFMGHSYYGVQSSSKAYFGKDVGELDLAECAALAGITNNPGIYNAFTEKGRENIKGRQELILKKMLELGDIDENQYNQAISKKLKFSDPEENTIASKAQSYFVDKVVSDVVNDLVTERKMSKDMALTTLYNYGLKIYTTQDSEMQKAMDEVFTNDKYFPQVNSAAKKEGEHAQAAMLIMDPYTGQVKAMYGGYGEKTASNTYNRATKLERQPGSSIKPIAVYGPAIDTKCITPATVVDDVPVYLLGNDEKRYPENFEHTYSGLTTIRNAIKRSVNVVAAKVWMQIPDDSLKYLKKVGIDRDDERYVSLAMGGLKKGVSPLQMTAAYVPFVNKGIYREPVTYTKVYDSAGNLLLEKKSKDSIVYDETSAFLMQDMMQEVVKGGTATRCKIQGGNMPTAGKTGTTSDNIDKWFVGYTPYYVSATWYGYDNKTKPIKLTSSEGSQAQIIWQAVMEKVHKNLKPTEFPQPSGLVKKKICIYSGKVATELCARDPRGNAVREEYFIKGTEPKDSDLCDVHVLAKVCTSSKDMWKRNLLAGQYCPPNTVVEKVFIQRSTPFVPVKPGDPYPLDWAYELPAGEYCNVHGAPSYPSTITPGTVTPNTVPPDTSKNNGVTQNESGTNSNLEAIPQD